tara:strand:- start:45 stop:350 length:306 start_codon:yes stop_codon:yes gene_type:complete
MGQPSAGHAALPSGEYIARVEQTRGTEPSKYPQEKKATAIPLVVANERGTAQTVGMFKPVCVVPAVLWGTIGSVHRLTGKLKICTIVEVFWKVQPKKVIVL